MVIKRTYFYFAVYLSSLIGLALAGYYVGDRYGLSHEEVIPGKSSRSFASDVSFYKLPRMNLTVASEEKGRTGKVRIDFSLEIEKKDIARMRDYQPRVCDKIVTFVRSQDMEALREPANQRVFREELLKEVNSVGSPVPILDIILRQMVFL